MEAAPKVVLHCILCLLTVRNAQNHKDTDISKKQIKNRMDRMFYRMKTVLCTIFMDLGWVGRNQPSHGYSFENPILRCGQSTASTETVSAAIFPVDGLAAQPEPARWRAKYFIELQPFDGAEPAVALVPAAARRASTSSTRESKPSRRLRF